MTARHPLASAIDEAVERAGERFKQELRDERILDCPSCGIPWPRAPKSEALVLTAIDAGFVDDGTIAGLAAEHFHSGHLRAIATVLIPLAKPSVFVNRDSLLRGLDDVGEERTAESWRKLFAGFDKLQPSMRGEPIRGHVELVIRTAKYRRVLGAIDALRGRLLLGDPTEEEIVLALRKMALDVKANA